ncbi:sn-glycerol-3-phosphate ABC transporter ATP-binding protein UgpC [Puniceicoccales bacterium CK1056]|uniref:sn-glycerol-3-phosphate ABC transporter ATP-binding protein UgpC n=1 Tax=Oceanipulchritudo coccoides TaxID=2706888 RepID=A0A6B2M2Q4_9BACT|nr:sn-glycerol-3-phosphate ABC transporter ATP-binding protein UgpC [Oceanipulchritudo coccoides]NDV62085.1 sn-glycerol-3-phosphate ABC transporter ATP-binding protein UgpC [Oceanipulchritudo coccoides]
MAEVSLKDLVKIYPASGKTPPVGAVKRINLDIKDREFMVLVGPSGCGKSTTLRMIAGLEEITEGEISIGKRVVNDIQPKNRDIAMVFQNYALYPHMTVFENMAFGLKLQKKPKEEINKRVMAAAEILGIESLLERKPKAMSGGQRQRVAVGRAIVRNPKVFLFDEPLSNLDAKMRVSMRTEISKLHARLGATMIYVTHDQVEAMTMGDRICVMKDGDIMQVAEPLQLYNSPENMFVAGFIGSPPMNFLHGTLTKEDGSVWFTEENPGSAPIKIKLSDNLAAKGITHVGNKVVFGIRPEDIADANTVTDIDPTVRSKAKVEVSEPMGAETFLYLDSGAHSFIAKVHSGDKYEITQNVELYFNMEKVHLFDPESEKVLRN